MELSFIIKISESLRQSLFLSPLPSSLISPPLSLLYYIAPSFPLPCFSLYRHSFAVALSLSPSLSLSLSPTSLSLSLSLRLLLSSTLSIFIHLSHCFPLRHSLYLPISLCDYSSLPLSLCLPPCLSRSLSGDRGMDEDTFRFCGGQSRVNSRPARVNRRLLCLFPSRCPLRLHALNPSFPDSFNKQK